MSNEAGAAGPGFAELAPVAAAWAWLDARPANRLTEAISLERAAGRVLADELILGTPAADTPRSAINGYAVCAAACVGASAYNPLDFALLPAGTATLPDAAGCPIASGWTLPAGADAVLPLDAAETDGTGRLSVLDAVPRGGGIEVRPPALSLPAGRLLRPQDIGCLAAAGYRAVTVLRRPRAALLVPGPKSGPDTLTPLLRALLARDGAALAPIALTAEDGPAMAAAFRAPALGDCDIVVLAGRAGTGLDDVAEAQIRAAGGAIALHGLALRPGGSAGLASLPRPSGTLPVLLLPGDPFGALVTYDLLAARLVRRLAGLAPALPYAVRTFPLARKIVSGLGSMDVVAVKLAGGRAEPLADAGLAGAALADGFVLVPEGSEGYPAGASVSTHLYDLAMRNKM